jgi:NTP pyrophosphatase (non-canonical NTP hydrolase)
MAKQTDKNTNINELREEYAQFVRERNWNKFHDPKSVAASLSIEANELLELFQWDSAEVAANKLQDPKWREKIESEVADVFIYLINFVNQSGIDLTTEFKKKMEKNREKFRVEAGDDLEEYHRVKEEYRRLGK